MYAMYADDKHEIEYVMDNLCDDTVIELKKMFGEDYKQTVINEINKVTDKYVIKLKKTSEPVGLYGFIHVNENAAGIYLLTTANLHKGNIITFLKEAKKQIKIRSKQYGVIMDSLYKKNTVIKKWLKLLGFKPSKYENEDFQIWYKGDINCYRVRSEELGVRN